MKKVQRGTSLELVAQWLEEGRLYVASSSDELVDRAVKEIMDRVGIVRSDVCDTYKDMYCKIWDRVMDIPSIRERILIKKGRNKNKTNWYLVSSVMQYLVIRNVYSCTLRHLAISMYGEKSSFRNNVNNPVYQLTDDEQTTIMEIIMRYDKLLK